MAQMLLMLAGLSSLVLVGASSITPQVALASGGPNGAHLQSCMSNGHLEPMAGPGFFRVNFGSTFFLDTPANGWGEPIDLLSQVCNCSLGSWDHVLSVSFSRAESAGKVGRESSRINFEFGILAETFGTLSEESHGLLLQVCSSCFADYASIYPVSPFVSDSAGGRLRSWENFWVEELFQCMCAWWVTQGRASRSNGWCSAMALFPGVIYSIGTCIFRFATQAPPGAIGIMISVIIELLAVMITKTNLCVSGVC